MNFVDQHYLNNYPSIRLRQLADGGEKFSPALRGRTVSYFHKFFSQIKFKWLLTGTVLTVVAYLLFQLRPSGTGFVLGDPDEFIYMKLVESIRFKHWPIYGGQPFYYDLPFFPLAALPFSLSGLGYLLSVRLVSFFSIILTSLILGYYVYKKSNDRAFYLITSAVFLFLPLSVFYSQVGIIDPLSTLLILSAVIVFDLAGENRSLKQYLLSGFLLGLAVLTKFTAIVPLALLGVYFFGRSLVLTFTPLGSRGHDPKGVKALGNDFTFKLHLGSLVSLTTALVIIFPTMLYFRLKDYENFSFQVGTIFGAGNSAGLSIFPFTNNLLPSWFTLTNLSFWFSAPVLLFSAVGFIFLLADRKHRLLSFVFLVLTYLVLARTPFHIRYFVVVLPFVCLAVVRGIKAVSFNNRKLEILLTSLLLLALLPANLLAFQSTRHQLLEKGIKAAGLPRQNFNGYIFSNYWPNFLAHLSEIDRSSWLAENVREVQAFYPPAEKNSFELLSDGGGYVFLEDFYSGEIINPPARSRAIEKIRTEKLPTLTIVENSPNFPYSRIPGDRLEIYEYR